MKTSTRLKIKYSAVVTGLFVAFCSFVEARSPIPDQALDDALLYRHSYATLLAPPEKKLPFFLIVDDEGTGYFAALGSPKTTAVNGVPEDWTTKLKTLKSDTSWAKFSRTSAKEVWGQPHQVPGRTVDIFDAVGHFNGESNIYHLDLLFDKFDRLCAYRVRGIGICHSRLVSLQLDGAPFVQPE